MSRNNLYFFPIFHDNENNNNFRNISPIKRKNPEHNFFSNFNINTHEFNDRVKKKTKIIS